MERARGGMIIILMGVTGSGKTTVGQLLAEQLGTVFADADDFHPPANKAKMAAGHPLNDADREGWLETLNQLLVRWVREGRGGVLACSALKEKYRSHLERGVPEGALTFCLLDLPRSVIEQRLALRQHEYMNPKLLESQLATLERPAPGEALQVMNDQDPSRVAAEIFRQLQAKASGQSK